MTLIDGKSEALKLRQAIAHDVADLAQKGIVPGLAVVLVGEDPASQVYVRNKDVQVREAGMASFAHHLPASTTQEELLALIRRLNDDEAVDGILVQLPLPKHIDSVTIIEAIAPHKDVDGFHPVNAGRLASGLDGFIPCTPLGCLLLLKGLGKDLAGLER